MSELPSKDDLVEYCQLNELQQQLYSNTVDRSKNESKQLSVRSCGVCGVLFLSSISCSYVRELQSSQYHYGTEEGS